MSRAAWISRPTRPIIGSANKTDVGIQMQGYRQFRTRRGVFTIKPDAGMFALWFEDEKHHHSPSNAAAAVADGGCIWPSFGDTSRLGIPEEIADWSFVRTG